MEPIALSEQTTTIAGILFVALVTVETGGLYLVRLVRGAAPATDLQLSFARAGHAHAGVLLSVFAATPELSPGRDRAYTETATPDQART